jgi:hypothetical protein
MQGIVQEKLQVTPTRQSRWDMVEGGAEMPNTK